MLPVAATGRGTGVFEVGRPSDHNGDGIGPEGRSTATSNGSTGGGVGILEAVDERADVDGGSGQGGRGGRGGGRGRGGRGNGGNGGQPSSGRPAGKAIAAGIAAAAVVAAGVAYAVSQSGGGSPVQRAVPVGAATATGPMRVTSVVPAGKTTGVDGAAPIVVTFSAEVAPGSPAPQISPAVPGQWSAEGNSMVFTPTRPFSPWTRVTVSIPAGATGVHSAAGALLSAPVSEHFRTSGYSQAGLATLLAQLGYLPMSWSQTATGAARAADTISAADPAEMTPAGEAYSPPPGTFTWDSGYPSVLRSMWRPDQANVLLRGAVMAFQSQHNMTIDGNLTPHFWRALFGAVASGHRNANGYTYAIASKRLPETLTIYHNGHVVLRSLANTGIPVSPTVDGTFPVYERFRFQIMRGTNPDGSHYADPVSFVSYFNGGDAVHYFPRGSYGFQQSLGCVELPYNSAARAFPYLTYGSLVTVTG